MKPNKQTVKLSVEIVLDDFGITSKPLTAEQKDEIVNNVLNGLYRQVNGEGICPEGIDGYTHSVAVGIAKSKKKKSILFGRS